MKDSAALVACCLAMASHAALSHAASLEKQNPYLCRDRAGTGFDVGAQQITLRDVENEIRELSGSTECSDAGSSGAPAAHFRLACLYTTKAEIYKRQGNYEAAACYSQAIVADPTEPAYELFYADYLRNFRGTGVPLQNLQVLGSPLIPEAQKHYVSAQAKLDQLASTGGSRCQQIKGLDRRAAPDACALPPDEVQYKGYPVDLYIQDTYRNIQRGLADLYQRDGLALTPWDGNTSGTVSPLLFFGSSNEFAQATTEFGSVDDTRSFTSEAQFSASPVRLGRLSQNQRQSIARDWLQVQTVNRLRLRNGDWPSVDAFFAYEHGDNQQIENFFQPTKTNDVDLTSFGVSLEHPFSVAPLGDFSVGAGYTRVYREGIVEFRPDKTETIDAYSVRAAASRFLGPDKLTLNGDFTYQDIEPNSVVAGGNNSGDHNRFIYGLTLSLLAPYLLPGPISGKQSDPYAQLYETNGVKFFTGFAHDFEAFGTADLEKNDYFVGASLLGWQPLGKEVFPFGVLSPPKFDITLQPTIFTADISDGDDEHNAQYRTSLSFVYTLLDEDRGVTTDVVGIDGEPRVVKRPRPLSNIDVAFLQVALPFRHDVALSGTSAYENVRVGIELDSKLTSYALGGTTFLASVGYDYQNFYQIDKDLNLFFVRLSMGF